MHLLAYNIGLTPSALFFFILANAVFAYILGSSLIDFFFSFKS